MIYYTYHEYPEPEELEGDAISEEEYWEERHMEDYAYNMGRRAYYHAGYDMNPHEYGTTEHHDWQRGYNDECRRDVMRRPDPEDSYPF